MNLAVTSSMGAGFFTAYAAQTPRRLVSTLNVVRAGQTIANHAFSKVSTAGVACFSRSGAHIIADVTGWYTGGAAPATVGPPVDPPPPGGPIPWIVHIPRLGLTTWVFDGDANRIVDAGHTWHWTGTGLVGQGGDSVLFGHRTEHGGPYRNQHLLRAGDELTVLTSDQRRYRYRMVAEASPASTPTTSSAPRGESVARPSPWLPVPRPIACRPASRTDWSRRSRSSAGTISADAIARSTNRRYPRVGGSRHRCRRPAGLAQLVEHLICNHEVASSILAPGSNSPCRIASRWPGDSLRPDPSDGRGHVPVDRHRGIDAGMAGLARRHGRPGVHPLRAPRFHHRRTRWGAPAGTGRGRQRRGGLRRPSRRGRRRCRGAGSTAPRGSRAAGADGVAHWRRHVARREQLRRAHDHPVRSNPVVRTRWSDPAVR